MKSDYTVCQVSRAEITQLITDYHYLTDHGFRSGYNYGLLYRDTPLFRGQVVGAAVYTGLSVPELAVGLFGLQRTEQHGLYELSRFCLHPETQQAEHNIASWFLARTLNLLRKAVKVRAVLSYADSDFHRGTLYQACNFSYYGLTAQKEDFWIKTEEGYKKHNRGPVRGIPGEWRPRSRKHRYLLVYDHTLQSRWAQQPYPKY